MNKLNTNKAFQARLQNAPEMPVQNEHSKDPNSKMDILWLLVP